MSSPPEETTFKLVFDGRLVAGRNATTVEEEFARRFGASTASSVFAASPVTLKRDLSRTRAVKIQKALAEIGMVVQMVPSALQPTSMSLVDEPGNVPLENVPPKQPRQRTEDESPSELGVIPARSTPSANKPGEGRRTYSTADLDKAFKGKATVPPASRSYLFKLLPVAALMLLLPLIYLAITAFSVYGVYWMSTTGREWFFTSHNMIYFRFIGFAAALIAMVLLTVFLIRPLLARSHRAPQPVKLDPRREPALYHLVERITESIGAPMPHEILVDTDVNASARLSRGALSRKLTLTIGLPLFYASDVQTLTGILAHEFGHFTQQWGMRSSYLIHRINFWFYRQVHQRDSWDEFVDGMHEQNFLLFSLAAMLAQLGSFLCRLLLSLLFFVARLVSFSLSRQMEFDADRYQTALLGSAQYARTAESIRYLGYGHQAAVQDLLIAVDGGKYANNLPRLAQLKTEKLSDSDRQKIAASVDEVNTSAFDTHPTDRARIRKAIESNLPPQFEHDGPAENLLQEIERLSELATLQWYRSLGIIVGPDDLAPLDQFGSESDDLEHASEVIVEYFGAYDPLPERMRLLDQRELDDSTEESLHADLEAVKTALQERQKEYIRVKAELDLHLEYQCYYRQALFWRRAGFPIDLDAYRLQLTTSDVAEIEQILEKHKNGEFKLRPELVGCVELQGKRLSLGLEIAARQNRKRRREVDRMRLAYNTVLKAGGDEDELYRSLERLDLLNQIVTELPDRAQFRRELKSESVKNEGLRERIRKFWSEAPDPRDDTATLADVLPRAYSAGASVEPAVVLADAVPFVRQLARAEFKLRGSMAEVALESERNLAS